MKDTTTARYPRPLNLDGTAYTLRPMAGGDNEAILAFARELPRHDLLFLNRDITNEKVVSAWAEAVESGTIATVLAERDGRIVGCGALIRDPLTWSPHLGEVRVLVAPEAREHGLGRELIQECFLMALDLGLKKLSAQMTIDQKGAIAIFEELGFSGEALLKNQVEDSDGILHDIVILSCDVNRAGAQLAAYGMAEAG